MMGKLQYIKCWIVFGIMMTSGTIADCPFKVCSCAWPTICCQQLGLKSFPALADVGASGYTSLNADTNQITEIPARCCPLNLTDVSFSHNPIAIIDDDAFNGSTFTLQSIIFWGANFTRIPDAFLKLHALKYVTMYDTIIQDWNDDAMKHIGQTVFKLDLRNVGLSSWPTWLQYFSQLNELNMDDSSISSVPNNAFDSFVHSLRGLSISNGSLTSLPKALTKLLVLESLDLPRNKIVDVIFTPYLSTLSAISLDHNRISNASQLSTALRPFGDGLISIMLNDNLLTSIPNVSFLTNIGSLDFSYNRIYDPYSGAVPLELYDIYLGNNFLPSIPALWSQLQSVTSLVAPFNSIIRIQGSDFHPSTTEVHLGHNFITELTDDSFPINSSIITIHLNSNPIAIISTNVFKNLPQLTTLDLQGTRLVHLPVQLESLTSLQSLDMSNSLFLVCTCNEKNLGPWIKSIQEVKGNCGLMSIRNFFLMLSPSCPDM